MATYKLRKNTKEKLLLTTGCRQTFTQNEMHKQRPSRRICRKSIGEGTGRKVNG
jgi:hypothetical protein